MTYYVAANDVLNNVCYSSIEVALRSAKYCRQEGATEVFLGLVIDGQQCLPLIHWERWIEYQIKYKGYEFTPINPIKGGFVRNCREMKYIVEAFKKERVKINHSPEEQQTSLGVELE